MARSGRPRSVATRRRWRQVREGAALAVVAMLLALYLAGAGFLWALKLDPRDATPATVPRYAYHYAHLTPVRTRLILSTTGAVALVGLTIGALAWPRRPGLHGDARFATEGEMSDANLFGSKGIVLGRVGRRLVRLPGQQGALIAWPPRTGKGVSIVIPNLLLSEDSVVTVDIKGENYRATAGWRAERGQSVYRLDLFHPEGRTHRWNPLTYAARDPGGVLNGLQRVAMTLFPEQGRDGFWNQSAAGLFVALGLYVHESPELPLTIGELLRQGMGGGEGDLVGYWRDMVKSREQGPRPLTVLCRQMLDDVLSAPPETLASIRKTFTTQLGLWLNPLVAAATAGDDFDLAKLRHQKLSIYVTTTYEDLDRLRPVLNLFFAQTLGLLTRVLPEEDPESRHAVLMILDEFPALGYLATLPGIVGVLPGYNVRLLIVLQTMAQLREVYGPNAVELFSNTLAAQVYVAPKEQALAEAISRALGNRTQQVRNRSYGAFGSGRHGTITTTLQPRPLLLPQEVKSMAPDRELIFIENIPPIDAQKVVYHEHPVLKARVLPAPLVQVKVANPPDEEKTSADSELSATDDAIDKAPPRIVESIPKPPSRRRASKPALRKRKAPDPTARSDALTTGLDPALVEAMAEFHQRGRGESD